MQTNYDVVVIGAGPSVEWTFGQLTSRCAEDQSTYVVDLPDNVTLAATVFEVEAGWGYGDMKG